MIAISTLSPSEDDLWFLPLGGTGEIGMNLNLYGHAGKWLMVDCGVTFNASLTPDSKTLHEVVSADPSFIADRHEDLVGIVITHAHEDHLGAVPQLWRRFRCPVYTTAFTAEFLRRKLAQVGLAGKVPIIEVESRARIDIGPFNVEWLPLTHSLPEPHSLVIRTDAGNVFHTADWKIDYQPVVGEPFDPLPFQELAHENITAMVCDSTNANRPGRSLSEGELYDGLYELIEAAEGRVVVGCFGSNIARLITLAKIAQQTGRYMALLGRSLQNMVSTAQATDVWPKDLRLIDASHLPYLPKSEVLLVATGSQGEPRTALNRLANNSHYACELDAGDTVIFSSIVIPGNELSVARLIAALERKEVHIVVAKAAAKPIHASGHPCADEVAELYRWVQPTIAIPVHGEAEHLHANAAIAKAAFVPVQLVGTNGDLYILSGSVRIRPQVVKAGRIALKQ
jgi:ribonuclease J